MEAKTFEGCSEKEKVKILMYLKEQGLFDINILTKKSGAQQLMKIHPQETSHLINADNKMYFSGTLDAISPDGILKTRMYCTDSEKNIGKKTEYTLTTTVFNIPIELIENIDIFNM